MISRVLRKEELKIRYVMTDIARSNIEYWMNHPFLQGFIKDGVLDFACYYHAERNPSLQLMYSGTALNPENVRNPLIVIGNYFFDTIPQDLFNAKEANSTKGGSRSQWIKIARPRS